MALRPQLLVNARAQLMVSIHRHNLVIPALKDVFHWFPVKHIFYKGTLLVYKCWHDIALSCQMNYSATRTAADRHHKLLSSSL